MPLPPPHPPTTAVMTKTNPRHAVSQARPAFHRFRKTLSGRSSIGTITVAEEAPGSVSVKTTVILYVPAGVVAEVAMLTAPLALE